MFRCFFWPAPGGSCCLGALTGLWLLHLLLFHMSSSLLSVFRIHVSNLLLCCTHFQSISQSLGCSSTLYRWPFLIFGRLFRFFIFVFLCIFLFFSFFVCVFLVLNFFLFFFYFLTFSFLSVLFLFFVNSFRLFDGWALFVFGCLFIYPACRFGNLFSLFSFFVVFGYHSITSVLQSTSAVSHWWSDWTHPDQPV